MAKKLMPVSYHKEGSNTRPSKDGVPLARLRRQQEYVLVDPATIETDQYESDPYFLKAYINAVRGQLKLVKTRVPIGEVMMGFLRPETSPPVLVVDPPVTEELVQIVLQSLARGTRPPLYLYELERTDVAFRYACPDDTAVLEAYRRFGTTQVPAAILGEPKHHHHAELVLVGIDDPETQRFHLDSTRPSELQLDSELQLTRPGTTAGEILETNRIRLERLLERLRKVHAEEAETHYHYVVASTLVRAIRAIDALHLLVERGRGETMLVIARSLYELATMFYLDWLAPETMGPILTHAAQLGDRSQTGVFDEIRRGWLSKGWSQAAAKAAIDGMKKEFNLARSIGDRCKLSPLRNVHKDLYAFLSSFAHQDAATAAEFTGYLSSDLDPLAINQTTFMRDARSACQTLNFSAGLIAYCVESDIGSFRDTEGAADPSGDAEPN